MSAGCPNRLLFPDVKKEAGKGETTWLQRGFEFGTAYAASKFGLEGWMQSLQAEVEPFGINTITVNPDFFRTELLTEESTNFAERTIEDYNERRAKNRFCPRRALINSHSANLG